MSESEELRNDALFELKLKKKPTIAELEAAIGTPDEMDILPDGSVRPKQESKMIFSDFKEDCFSLGMRIKETKKRTMLVFNEHPVFDEEQTAHDVNDPPDEGAAKRASAHGEMKANLMLVYRHLEDASMRLGKAIQAFDGGKFCCPR